jgi:aspartate carbamoyltransferase catalytic subunit
MKELSVDHLLGIKYINKKNGISTYLKLLIILREVINRPIKKVASPSLRDITIANIFWKIAPVPKLSFFELACCCQSDVVSSAAQHQLKKEKHPIDTVNNILPWR